MASAGERDANPWSEETKNKFESKSKSEWFDPCQDAASRSIRCLNRNGGDRAMCQDYFEAYRDCKKQWMDQRKERAKKGGTVF